MNKDQRIASLAMKLNRLIDKHAQLEARKIKNVWVTECGNVIQIVDPDVFERQIETVKKDIDKALKDIDKELDDETTISDTLHNQD